MDTKPSYRFLVVDDCITTCSLLRVLLEENGHKVVGEASDGRDALTLYRKLQPDFVTMDLDMPQQGGNTAMREILEFDPGARIIVISALDRTLVPHECEHVKKYEVASKPVRWVDVSAAISRFDAVSIRF